MKSKLIPLFIIASWCCLPVVVAAQNSSPSLSFHLYGGLGIFGPGADRTNDLSGGSGNFSGYSYQYVNGKPGYGNGIQGGAGLSLKLSNIVSIGLDGDFLYGSGSFYYNFTSQNYITTTKESHKFFSVIPNVSFTFWSKPGYELYNTVGLMVAFSPQANSTVYDTYKVGDFSTFVYNYKFGTGLGAKDAIGCRVPIAKHIKAFAEVFGYFLGSRPTSLYNQVLFGSLNQTYVYKYGNSGTWSFTSSSVVSGVNDTQVETFNNWPGPASYFIYSIGVNAGIAIDIK